MNCRVAQASNDEPEEPQSSAERPETPPVVHRPPSPILASEESGFLASVEFEGDTDLVDDAPDEAVTLEESSQLSHSNDDASKQLTNDQASLFLSKEWHGSGQLVLDESRATSPTSANDEAEGGFAKTPLASVASPKSAEESLRAQKIRCRLCGHGVSRPDVKKHALGRHMSVKPFSCALCPFG